MTVLKLLLTCFALYVLPCQCQAVATHEQLVHLQLEAIPVKDKESLSLFFEALIRLDTFGYTIFGNKPISATGCWTQPNANSFIFNKETVYRKGQELWEKYSPKLQIKNFVLKFEKTDEWYGIFLINKKAFTQTVERHLDEFKQVLGETITPNTLLLQIVDTKNSIGHVLKEDDCLLGIVFGYGYKNASLYKRRHEVLNHLKATSESAGILDLFPEVGFLADLDDEETKQLLQEYGTTQPKILTAFLSNNFLETILCRMTQE